MTPPPIASRPVLSRPPLRINVAGLLAVSLLSAGCAVQDIDSTYGRRRATRRGDSVNGVGVLAGMFEQQGHKVSTWRRLSPRLHDYDVIVWAPDDFDPPGEKERDFLRNWLKDGDRNRTLVYIGRDYDAAPDYWRSIQNSAPPEQALEVIRRQARAQAAHDQRRARMPQKRFTPWMVARRDEASRLIRAPEPLEGEWSASVDPAKVEIHLHGRLAIPLTSDIPKGETVTLPDFDPLLASRDDVLVAGVTDESWGDSKLILVANGSFLLNLPLVNHEHRKLAGKLVGACGPPGRAVFLESGPGGLPVYDEEPSSRLPTGLEVFTIWPLNGIFLHLAILGIVVCFALFPIFGRARHEQKSSLSDFGRHIDALGELLQLTRDEGYARARLAHYHQHVKRDSGVSHARDRGAG